MNLKWKNDVFQSGIIMDLKVDLLIDCTINITFFQY